MAKRYELSDASWEVIKDLVSSEQKIGRPRSDDRLVLQGILWILGSAAAWCDLPERFGPWSPVIEIFVRHGLERLQGASVEDYEFCCRAAALQRCHSQPLTHRWVGRVYEAHTVQFVTMKINFRKLSLLEARGKRAMALCMRDQLCGYKAVAEVGLLTMLKSCACLKLIKIVKGIACFRKLKTIFG